MTANATTSKPRRARRNPRQARIDAIVDTRQKLATRLRAIRAERDDANARIERCRRNALAARVAFDANDQDGAALIKAADKRLEKAIADAPKAQARYREALAAPATVNARARADKAVRAFREWEAKQVQKEIDKSQKARRKAVESGLLQSDITEGEKYAIATGDVVMGQLIDQFGSREKVLAALSASLKTA